MSDIGFPIVKLARKRRAWWLLGAWAASALVMPPPADAALINGNFDARSVSGFSPLTLALDSWNKTKGDNDVYILDVAPGGVGSHSEPNEAALCDASQIWQDTDDVIALGTYTLTWWDRDRTGSTEDRLDVTASLRGATLGTVGASTTVLKADIGTAWTQRTLTWTVGNGDPLIGQNLRVQFAAANVTWKYDQTSIDDVQVTFNPIPEPSALALVGFGLLGTWQLGRRRRA
jgi:hypothetical protein